MTMSDDMLTEVLLSDSECTSFPASEPLPRVSEDILMLDIDTKRQSTGDIVRLIREAERKKPRFALIRSKRGNISYAIKTAELIRALCPETRVSVWRDPGIFPALCR